MFRTVLSLKDKLGAILTEKQKKRMILLIIAMLIGALLEAVGLSAMVPFVTIMTQEGAVDRIPIVSTMFSMAGITSDTGKIIICIVLMIIIYVFKALYLLNEYRLQVSFVSDCRRDLHDRTATALLEKPYVYFLSRNTAEMHRALSTDISKVSQVIEETLTLLTEIIICLTLIVVLFLIHPAMSASTLLLVILTIVMINLYVRSRLVFAGNASAHSGTQHTKWISQGFGGIKEVKHLHAEKYVAAQLGETEKILAKSEAQKNYLRRMPRVIVETLCICGMLGILSVMVLLGEPLLQLLPIVSAFAMAALKLLPSADRITAAVSGLNFNLPALDNLTEILIADREGVSQTDIISGSDPGFSVSASKESGRSSISRNSRDLAVCFQNVSFRYPGSEADVLRNVSLEIPFGMTIGIVGPSGAGKTTLADILLGLLTPDSGEVFVNAECIGYIPQNLFMLDDTVRANVTFGTSGGEIRDDLVWSCLEEAQVAEHFRSVPDGLDMRIGERGTRLSGGQVQRIGIARALYRRPDVLVLDEATSALDPETESAVMETVSSLHGKRTIIIVAHGEAPLTCCDRVYRVHDGKLSELVRAGEKWLL